MPVLLECPSTLLILRESEALELAVSSQKMMPYADVIANELFCLFNFTNKVIFIGNTC